MPLVFAVGGKQSIMESSEIVTGALRRIIQGPSALLRWTSQKEVSRCRVSKLPSGNELVEQVEPPPVRGYLDVKPDTGDVKLSLIHI